MEWIIGGVFVFVVLVLIGLIGSASEKAPDKPTDMADLYEEMENRRRQIQHNRKRLNTTAKVGAGVAAGAYGFKKGWQLGKWLM